MLNVIKTWDQTLQLHDRKSKILTKVTSTSIKGLWFFSASFFKINYIVNWYCVMIPLLDGFIHTVWFLSYLHTFHISSVSSCFILKLWFSLCVCVCWLPAPPWLCHYAPPPCFLLCLSVLTPPSILWVGCFHLHLLNSITFRHTVYTLFCFLLLCLIWVHTVHQSPTAHYGHVN